MHRLLIRNAFIAHPQANAYSGDVACVAGKIVRIDQDLPHRRMKRSTPPASRTLADIQKWICYGPAQTRAIANKDKILEEWNADPAVVDVDILPTVRNEQSCTQVKCSPYVGRAPRVSPVRGITGGEIVPEQGRAGPGVPGKPLAYTQ